MYLKPVGIYNSGMTAYGSKIKTRFTFFDEVLHQSSFAVKFDEIGFVSEKDWRLDCLFYPAHKIGWNMDKSKQKIKNVWV